MPKSAKSAKGGMDPALMVGFGLAAAGVAVYIAKGGGLGDIFGGGEKVFTPLANILPSPVATVAVLLPDEAVPVADTTPSPVATVAVLLPDEAVPLADTLPSPVATVVVLAG